MTEEQKKILLKDLSARLSYNVKGKVETIDGNGQKITDDGVLNSIFIDEYGATYICVEGAEYDFEDVKPYLRPMLSMSDADRKELAEVGDIEYIDEDIVDFGEFLRESSPVYIKNIYGILDWLLEHHFDYRGLIGMGLALEAPEGMYNELNDNNMTEEEKRLLFQDLVARVPYGVKGKTLGCKTCTLVYIGVAGDFTADTYHGWIGRKQFVPYLRPMESMSEEEFKEWHDRIRPMYDGKPYESEGADIDFFNKHHIDYRGLIEKGLALEAPEGMYNWHND